MHICSNPTASPGDQAASLDPSHLTLNSSATCAVARSYLYIIMTVHCSVVGAITTVTAQSASSCSKSNNLGAILGTIFGALAVAYFSGFAAE
ncbi:hypothetical protein B0H19DRAFT_591437 [Mycena capillaripes]|nr:hypothetical protein B0H19DRAFT_591437 [Mycena capillaripes]